MAFVEKYGGNAMICRRNTLPAPECRRRRGYGKPFLFINERGMVKMPEVLAMSLGSR